MYVHATFRSIADGDQELTLTYQFNSIQRRTFILKKSTDFIKMARLLSCAGNTGVTRPLDVEVMRPA